jgi:2-oxoglutarate ferredoxin oxidoreductase subunit gamma
MPGSDGGTATKHRTFQIRISGSGGQGIITAGIILAEAASLYEGHNAVQTQSYGPESRGGAAKSEVVISDTEIDYPKVSRCDVLLAMTEEACQKYLPGLAPDGLAIIDSSMVSDAPDGPNIVAVPITETARKVTGRAIAANIVALGIVTELTGAASRESIRKAVLLRVPKGTEQMNEDALNAGFKLGEEIAAKRP